jgi:predicted ATPase/DNA-binding winged helix-turn-helix (wHTH) protein
MDNLIKLDACIIDLERQEVTRGDKLYRLTEKEGALLDYLLERAPEAVTREELLAEVWGYGPTVVSRTLDTTVHNLRAKVEARPRSPVHILTVRGVGYQLALPEAPERPSTPELPRHSTTFVGREQSLEALGEAFDEGARLVTLMGPGGAGKTRLALRYGRSHPRESVRFCDLSEVTSCDGFCQELARTLQLDGSRWTPTALGDALTLAVAEGRVRLLILDNFEQLVNSCADFVGRWLARAPELNVLVTSRRRLLLAAERTLHVGPLEVPADGVKAEAMARSESVRLFMDRARASRPDLPASREHLELVADIARQLDGLPLAIELAAAQAAVMSIREIRDRIQGHLDLLRSGWRDLPPRHRTLRSTLDGSWTLLSETERQALAQCSVFRDGFSLDAAEQVLALPRGAFTLDVLRSLVEHSLLRTVSEPEGLRFQLFRTVRLYAGERLRDLGEADEREAAARHGRWCAALGEAVLSPGRDPDRARAARRETANLRAALTRALAREDADSAAPVAGALASLALTSGPDVALAASAAADALRLSGVQGLWRARLLQLEGYSLWLSGPRELALECLWQALELAPEDGALISAHALMTLSVAEDRDKLAALSERTLALIGACRASGGPAEAPLMLAQGMLRRRLGARDEARGHWQQALERCRRAGDRRYEALSQHTLGTLELRDGRYESARHALERALTLFRGMHDHVSEADTLRSLGTLSLDQDLFDDARWCLEEALSIHSRLGSVRGAASDLSGLAALFLRRGDASAALSCARRGLEDADLLRDPALSQRFEQQLQEIAARTREGGFIVL